MTPRPPMPGETGLSPSEAAYLYREHELQQWTTPNSTAMNANAVNGLRESEPSAHELNLGGEKC